MGAIKIKVMCIYGGCCNRSGGLTDIVIAPITHEEALFQNRFSVLHREGLNDAGDGVGVATEHLQVLFVFKVNHIVIDTVDIGCSEPVGPSLGDESLCGVFLGGVHSHLKVIGQAARRAVHYHVCSAKGFFDVVFGLDADIAKVTKTFVINRKRGAASLQGPNFRGTLVVCSAFRKNDFAKIQRFSQIQQQADQRKPDGAHSHNQGGVFLRQ